MRRSKRKALNSLIGATVLGGIFGTVISNAVDPWWPKGAWEWWVLGFAVAAIVFLSVSLRGKVTSWWQHIKSGRKLGWSPWLVAVVTSMFVLFSFTNGVRVLLETEEERVATMAKSELWNEVQQYRRDAKHCLEDGVHRGLVKAVQEKMLDPGSFEAKVDTFVVGPLSIDGTRRAAFEFLGSDLFNGDRISNVAVALMVNETCNAVVLSLTSEATLGRRFNW